ncbi:MAG: NUDIX hydrolase [Flavobacteriales bacterium]
MARMYEVYIMNRAVFFQENASKTEQSLIIREPGKKCLNELPQLIRDHPGINAISLVCSNPEEQWMQFCFNYREVLAAGCIVTNKLDHLLWIERNGKWDLPKGKVEPKEAIEDAALREVEEETGIQPLALGSFIDKTYHTYDEGGTPILKTTFWYHAFHDGDDTPGNPQSIEGITDVHWIHQDDLAKIENNSYPSITALVNKMLDNR